MVHHFAKFIFLNSGTSRHT